MNSLLDQQMADDIIGRLQQLTPDHKAEWGKMSAHQMLSHCADVLRDILGDRQTPVLVSPEVAERARQIILAPEPFPHDLRAIKLYRQEDGGTQPTNFQDDRTTLISLVKRLQSTAENFSFGPHPAIGFLSRDEHGFHTWKHLDHHLRQFGV